MILAALIASYMAYSGKKKQSLNTSGALAAIFVGFASFSCSYRFGLMLIMFYFTSSKLTKTGHDRKAQLEEGHKVGGQRDYIQVFCNSILATIVCIVYYLCHGEDRLISFSDGDGMLSSGHLWSIYVAHYACATADTWASEVGILATSKPRLVTTFFLREVPPGTNGGMSLLGTAASAAGGLFIGTLFTGLSFFFQQEDSELVQYPMLLVGLISGVLGSLIDSILGATMQATYYSKSKQMIAKGKKSKDEDSSVVLLCGTDILSNEAVNFISILMTMAIVYVTAPYIFCIFDSRVCTP